MFPQHGGSFFPRRMTEHPRNPAGEEESYHQGTASMSTAAALEQDDAFTPAPPARRLTVTERARETPVHAETEVLVVGGGPAGCGAALAARGAGAEGRVL